MSTSRSSALTAINYLYITFPKHLNKVLCTLHLMSREAQPTSLPSCFQFWSSICRTLCQTTYTHPSPPLSHLPRPSKVLDWWRTPWPQLTRCKAKHYYLRAIICGAFRGGEFAENLVRWRREFEDIDYGCPRNGGRGQAGLDCGIIRQWDEQVVVQEKVGDEEEKRCSYVGREMTGEWREQDKVNKPINMKWGWGSERILMMNGTETRSLYPWRLQEEEEPPKIRDCFSQCTSFLLRFWIFWRIVLFLGGRGGIIVSYSSFFSCSGPRKPTSVLTLCPHRCSRSMGATQIGHIVEIWQVWKCKTPKVPKVPMWFLFLPLNWDRKHKVTFDFQPVVFWLGYTIL